MPVTPQPNWLLIALVIFSVWITLAVMLAI
jgi:hypothetical protein